ncbi:hypothetical protein JR316_0008522 [Psilocybe cubensis]|uniref:Uncharacterized protein n=1 Tax=Psilocybe cubensis TaxID=181762 RepID=A0ACB8GWH7_PSICU|nr:hypothetical protein JR316_0008522 [Psilocybe cubensis]KAH9479926.1 hypothetical protein JR316_0008522 [Psilocybe cubensis]
MDIKPLTTQSFQSKPVDRLSFNQSAGPTKAQRRPPVQPSPQDEERSNKLPETCPTPTMVSHGWKDGSLYYNNPYANQQPIPDSQLLKAMDSYLNLSPSQRYLPSELKMLNQREN